MSDEHLICLNCTPRLPSTFHPHNYYYDRVCRKACIMSSEANTDVSIDAAEDAEDEIEFQVPDEDALEDAPTLVQIT